MSNRAKQTNLSPTMYYAIMEIAENGERFAPADLNVSLRTVRALANRGWIAIENGRACVTAAGWQAVARTQ